MILNLEGRPDMKRAYNINNPRYADSSILVAEYKENLQADLNMTEEESSKMGLKCICLGCWLCSC